MGEFASWVTDLTKTLLPNVSVEHNVAYSAKSNPTVANCEEVIAACDYAGGDLYGDLYNQSFACKFYRSISKKQPFEYMFSRCAPNLTAHTQIKSPDVMYSAIALTAAHHGATLVIDAIDPIGTMDCRVYEQIGKAFEKVMPHEPFLKGEMRADVGVYYSLKSKFDAQAEGYTNHRGTLHIQKSMISAHIPCKTVGGFTNLDDLPCIIAPCLTEEDAYDVHRLVEYVKRGGLLYFSGGECHTLLREFFEIDTLEGTKEIVTYLSPTARAQEAFGHYNPTYPLHFDGTAPLIDTNRVNPDWVLATLTLPYTHQHTSTFASIHSNPPGIRTNVPVILSRALGAGRVIWSALPLECPDSYDHSHVLLSLLRDAGLAPSLASDAPDDVEITVFEDEDRVILHTVELNTAHSARKLADFDVTVRIEKEARGVRRITDNTSVPFSLCDGGVRFTVNKPQIFETFIIE